MTCRDTPNFRIGGNPRNLLITPEGRFGSTIRIRAGRESGLDTDDQPTFEAERRQCGAGQTYLTPALLVRVVP